MQADHRRTCNEWSMLEKDASKPLWSCRERKEVKDMAGDWLCQDQGFFPGLWNPAGFSFTWFLALLGINANSQMTSFISQKATFNSGSLWFQRAHRRGWHKPSRCARWWGVYPWGCTALGQSWDLGPGEPAAVTHQWCPGTVPSTHARQPLQRLSQQLWWRRFVGLAKARDA